MAERIRRRHDLPVPPDAVLAILADPDAVQRRCAADGLGTRLVSHQAGDDVTRIVVATDVPVDWLPSAVRSRLTSDPTVERTEEWTRSGGGARSPLVFSFAGLPVSCEGEAELTPSAAGSELVVDLTMRVDVPFVGGLVERAVAPRISSALDAEAAFYGSH